MLDHNRQMHARHTDCHATGSDCAGAMFWPRFARTFRRRSHLRSEWISELMISTKSTSFFVAVVTSFALTMATGSAVGASCGAGSFPAWLEDFKTEAAAKGISQAAI